MTVQYRQVYKYDCSTDRCINMTVQYRQTGVSMTVQYRQVYKYDCAVQTGV